jgi:hypothetical protein
VFLKYTKMNNVSGMNADTPSWATRTEQGRDDGATFVSNFLQDDTRGAIGGTGKYEQFVTRMSFAFLSLSQ